jgi:threonine/homoserine/homoserine lactone efflux protein
VPIAVLIAFTAVAATLIVLPGPDWALVLAAGTRGQGRVPATVGGIAIGYLLITAVVAAGVAPLVAATPALLVILTVVGAAYLLYLGIGILRRPAAHEPIAAVPGPATGAGRTLVQGIGVSALNPKSLLFFLAFLPQFARPGAAWPVAVQLLVLGGVWVALGSTFYTLLGCTAEHHRPTTRPGPDRDTHGGHRHDRRRDRPPQRPDPAHLGCARSYRQVSVASEVR